MIITLIKDQSMENGRPTSCGKYIDDIYELVKNIFKDSMNDSNFYAFKPWVSVRFSEKLYFFH